MTNTSTPRATDNGSIFDGIRPAALTYANHAKNADDSSTRLKDHADIGAVWDRFSFLAMVNQNAGKTPERGVALQVAREVLGLADDVTLTRVEGVTFTADQKRLEALKVWIERNRPKADAAPKSRTLRVVLSGEGGGSTTVAEDHPLYAALVALVTGADADADADA